MRKVYEYVFLVCLALFLYGILVEGSRVNVQGAASIGVSAYLCRYLFVDKDDKEE